MLPAVAKRKGGLRKEICGRKVHHCCHFRPSPLLLWTPSLPSDAYPQWKVQCDWASNHVRRFEKHSLQTWVMLPIKKWSHDTIFQQWVRREMTKHHTPEESTCKVKKHFKEIEFWFNFLLPVVRILVIMPLLDQKNAVENQGVMQVKTVLHHFIFSALHIWTI